MEEKRKRAYSQAQNKAIQRYIKANYDQVSFRVPKGKKEEYLKHAEAKGIGLTQLLVDLIEADMKNS